MKVTIDGDKRMWQLWPRRFGQAVRLSDGTESVYIGPLGNGQHQIDTAAGETRIVGRRDFERVG
jgi:hypothetical protein